MGHPLLAKLIVLQLVLAFDLEIFLPHHHIHQTPGGAGGAIAAAHSVVFDIWHGGTEADGFAVTASCVGCRSGVWEEQIFMHDDCGMDYAEKRFLEALLGFL